LQWIIEPDMGGTKCDLMLKLVTNIFLVLVEL